MSRPYREFNSKGFGIPLITYENTWVSIFGPGADLKLFDTGSMSLRIRARYELDGYQSDDSPFLLGMKDRKNSVWLGGAFVWNNDLLNLSVEALNDAMRNSKGSRAKVQVDHRFSFGSFGVTPRLAAEWVNKKYVEYYYGVKASEARPWRSSYQGDATINAEAGVRLDYMPSSHHTLFLDVGVTRLGSQINNSPLLAKADQGVASAGYIYRF